MDNDVFRALADASRRELLDRLNAHNGQSLRALCAGLGMARQSVSKHLAVLEAAGLVITGRRGREKLHCLNAAPINAIAERWMHRYDRERASALADLKRALEEDPMANPFVYTTYIRTTPERVWQALTDPAFTERYWGVRLESEWTVGATVTWSHGSWRSAEPDQVVLESAPPRRLSYRWHHITHQFGEEFGLGRDHVEKAAREPLSTVTFDIEPAAAELVKLTVVHDGFPDGSTVRESVGDGWPHLLSSLKTMLETGQTLPEPEPEELPASAR